MDHSTDNNTLIETLLLERDELYQKLSRLRDNDKGTLEVAREKNREYETNWFKSSEVINKTREFTLKF